MTDVVVTGLTEHFGGLDFYTVKYSGANGAIRWERRISGDLFRAVTVTVDAKGDVCVAGGIDLPGARELIVKKYAGSNGALVWEKQTDLKTESSAVFQDVSGIACDPSGNLAIVLRTSSAGSSSSPCSRST